MNRTRFGLAVALFVVCLFPLSVGAQSSSAGQNEAWGEAELVSHGHYLAMIAGCNDCHTQGYLLAGGKVPEGQWLTGSDLGWRGPWGTTYAVNLRLFPAPFSEEQWIALARQLPVRPPMPWYALNVMRERDPKSHLPRHLQPRPRRQAGPGLSAPGPGPDHPLRQVPGSAASMTG